MSWADPATRVPPTQPPTTQSFFLSSETQPSAASENAVLLRMPASAPSPSMSRATPVAIRPTPWRPSEKSFWTRRAP